MKKYETIDSKNNNQNNNNSMRMLPLLTQRVSNVLLNE